MAYQVLARKYRSRTFDEVVGQTPIATTLKNAIATGRIHHGYLFTGTRGVGKTSMARILAKALNCLSSDRPTPTPCLECEACRLIAEGQDLDVVEIDAASNTGVDNIRELRSNAAYRPARCRFKIYIIDEVHMLSTGAFNALLKTLEEPPEHVKFILATTEIQKVPATIQSRCQRFTFRNIGPEDIRMALRRICDAEGVQADDDVLARVARLANGSMRDALSILDQLLSVAVGGVGRGSSGNGGAAPAARLTMQVLNDVLPPPQNEQFIALLQAIASADASAVLARTEDILSGGRGLEVFCAEMIEVLRTLMLLRASGGSKEALAEAPAGMAGEYQGLSERFELSHYVQMISALEELRRNIRYSAAGRALLEVTLVRFAKLSEWAPIEQLVQQLAGGGDAAPPTEEKKKFVAPEFTKVAPTAPAGVAADTTAPRSAAVRTAAAADAGRVQASQAVSARIESVSPSAPTISRASSTSRPIPPPAVQPTPVPVPSASSSELSSEERRQLEADPAVRKLVEAFDAVLVHVERRSSSTPTTGPDDPE